MNKVLSWMSLNQRFGWLLCIPFFAVLVAWGFDRELPFEFKSVPAVQIAQGETGRLSAVVRRDVSRGCSVRYSRYLFDGGGFRHDLNGPQEMSVEDIADLQKRMPDRLNMFITVPPGSVPGRACIVTYLSYVCNPVHVVFPINARTEICFAITEKTP